jgi:hypothetical protein
LEGLTQAPTPALTLTPALALALALTPTPALTLTPALALTLALALADRDFVLACPWIGFGSHGG